MNIWLIVGLSIHTGEREVYDILFSADLVEQTIKEIFECVPELNQVTIETWYREEGSDDACFYDEVPFFREDE